MIRSFLHRLSRGIVLKRSLPAEFGGAPIFVSPESALGYWKWNLERVDPFLLSVVREFVRPGMHVWDIGANLGLFAFAAAGLGADVVAVEADCWLVKLLQKSANGNGLPVTVVSAAVSDVCGEAILHISPEGRSSNSLHGEGRGQDVRLITLDWMLTQFPAPDLIKIDVEGMECAVLQGARKVLQHQPILFCEVTRNHEEVGALLNSAGYTLYTARQQQRTPIRRPSVDTLALPNAAAIPSTRIG